MLIQPTTQCVSITFFLMLSKSVCSQGESMVSTQTKRGGLGKPTPAQVEIQLARILQSGETELSRRGADLLKFVVGEALAGREDYLKAFTIATQVLNRDARFDAQNDPCVRIEAARLRRALEHYYLVLGVEDLVEIAIPKGGYRPVFNLRRPADLPVSVMSDEPSKSSSRAFGDRIVQKLGRTDRRARNAAFLIGGSVPAALFMLGMLLQASSRLQGHEASGGKPAVIVENFDSEGAADDGPVDASGNTFRDEIILKLFFDSRMTILTQMPPDIDNNGAFYRLYGAARQDHSALRVSAVLVREADGVVVWTGSDGYPAGTSRNAIERAAESFALEIAERLAEGGEQRR